MILLFKGRASQVFQTIKLLSETHGKLTLKDYHRLAVLNGGR